MASSDRILDELLCFLGDPIFQIPVRTFMDEHCLIFEPSIEQGDDHTEVHAKYKKLIDTLLESFCQDTGIELDQALSGIKKMSQIQDLKEVFNVIFEQVSAATDYDIFSRVMTKRNIMIQEQVLVMIIAATGGLPSSLQSGDDAPKKPLKTGKTEIMTAGAVAAGPSDDKQEAELIKQVMEKSVAEAEAATKAQKKEEQEMLQAMAISKTEVSALRAERAKLEDDMKKLTLESNKRAAPPPAKAAPLPAAATYNPTPNQASRITHAPPPVKATAKTPGISGADAAAQWEKSAMAEAGAGSATHAALQANFAKMSPEELKKRQAFLKEQRDKLLAMKKEAREKQLGKAEKTGPARPTSARTARSAMKQAPEVNPQEEEDQKKIQMRKAIADRLRMEVIGKQ